MTVPKMTEFTYAPGLPGGAGLIINAVGHYKSPIVAALEPTDNSAETSANARHIWIITGVREVGHTRQHYLETIDDGEGMEPLMRQGDLQKIETMLLQRVQNRAMREVTIYDPKYGVPKNSPTWRSLQAVVESIAKSQRELQESGKRHTGTLAFLEFATDQTIVSKPSQALHNAFWGQQATGQPRQAYELRHFNFERLTKYDDTTYHIGPATIPLADPITGKALDHGTMVRVTGVRQDRERFLTRPMLVDTLRERYSEDIRAGRVAITVLERVVDKDWRVKSEAPPIKLTPFDYNGLEILDNVEFDCGFGQRSRMSIYFDQAAQGNKRVPVAIRYKGRPKFHLSDLPEFAGTIFVRHGVSGWVDLPVWPNEDQVLNIGKDGLEECPERVAFTKAVLGFSKQVEQQIEEVRNRSLSRDVKHLTDALSDAVAHCFKNVDFLRGQYIGGGVGTGGEGPVDPQNNHGPAGPKPQTVALKILNQHEMGVAGVACELRQGIKLVASGNTDSEGRYSFDRQPLGRGYHMLYRPPQGTAPLRFVQTPLFALTPEQPGKYQQFHLHDPKAVAPDRPANQTGSGNGRKTTRPKFEFIPLTSRHKPYEDRLDRGTIIINSGYPPLRQALAKGEEDGVVSRLATYIASAITGRLVPYDTEYYLRYIAIHEQMLQYLMENKTVLNLKKLAQLAA